ncbi:MAG: DUF126 domain-containing protein [Candidatus Aenigmarchaeota archaeon]|nr:DUF126 domain-containing protein [Candidatus Aenigmarchaeota archaeon]
MKLNARKISKGKTKGKLLVSKDSISFFGGVDPDTGIVVEKGHDLEGKTITDKILVFPNGKGSTVGSYTLYRLKKNNKAPLAIINKECEAIVAVGAIISQIPLIDKLEKDSYFLLKTGRNAEINADKGELILEE